MVNKYRVFFLFFFAHIAQPYIKPMRASDPPMFLYIPKDVRGFLPMQFILSCIWRSRGGAYQ